METQHGGSQSNGSGMKWILGVILIAIVIAGGVGLAYISRDRAQLSDLTAANQTLSASLKDLRGQLQSMTAKLDEQAAAARAEAAARTAPGAPIRPGNSSGAPARMAGTRQMADSRLSQIQSRLEAQQKAISSNQEDLTRTRNEMQSKLDSTRDELSGSISSSHAELSGSIARTHDEVVALQKRGERNYYEFTLNKSKEFRRVGPLSLSVRKVNTKHKSYDLAMFVNDNELQKKGVNLFEPVWINLQDQSQPVQLVVNQISKDEIQGYISAPKFTRSELGDTAAAGPAPSSAAQPALKQP